MSSRIRLYLRLMRRIPDKMQWPALFYQYMQNQERQGIRGNTEPVNDLADDIADAFAMSNSMVRRYLKRGDGIFWHVDRGMIYRHGYERVYECFGLKPSAQSTRIRMEFLRRGTANMRKIVYAMKVASLIEEEGRMLTRKQIAKQLGVSESTTRNREDNGFVETLPTVDILGLVPSKQQGQVMFTEIPDLEGYKKERLWDAKKPNGEWCKLVVRQQANLYRPQLGLGERIGSNTTMAKIYSHRTDLLNVPKDTELIGAVLFDPDLEEEKVNMIDIGKIPTFDMPVGWKRG